MNIALDPASEQVIQRELDRGHFTTPAEVVASALLLLKSQEDWLQENKGAINARLELSFDQSRNGETYSPGYACQIACRANTKSTAASELVLLKGMASAVPQAAPEARGFSP